MSKIINKRIFFITVTLAIFSTLVIFSYAGTEKQKHEKAMQIEKGEILTVEHGCVFCHSPKITKENDLIPDPERLFSGHPSDKKLPDIPKNIIGEDKWFGLYTTGFTAWGGPWGVSYAANLTPDKETGIGDWTEKDFINVIRLGIHSSFKRRLMPPMPWDEMYTLTDDDLGAIFQYLRTVKAVKNDVPDSVPMSFEEDLASK